MNTYPEMITRESKLQARIKELEDRISMQAEQIEAMTPKSEVVSEWTNTYACEFHHDSKQRADCADDGSRIACIRLDTITHSDGRVEHKVEIEK